MQQIITYSENSWSILDIKTHGGEPPFRKELPAPQLDQLIFLVQLPFLSWLPEILAVLPEFLRDLIWL